MNASASTRRTRRDWFAFDRYDRWGLTGLCVTTAAVAVTYGVVRPLDGWGRGAALEVPYSGEVTVPRLDAAHMRHGIADHVVLIDSPSTAQRLLDMLPRAAMALLITVCCWLVYRLVRGIGAGRPFRDGTVTRIRVLGAALALGVPVVWFLHVSCVAAVLALADLPVITTLSLPWLPVLAGTTIALIAEAFKAGAQLQRDVDGLV